MSDPLAPFRQAEAQFRWLTQQRATGQMDDAAFRSALDGLRLQDAQGNWWMPQEGTGTWLRWDGSQWLPGSPYPAAQTPATMAGAPPTPPIPAVAANAGSPAVAAPDGPATPAKSVMGAALKWLAILLVAAAAIVAAVVIFGKKPPDPGLLLALVIIVVVGWLIILATLASSWEGQVVDIRTQRRTHRDSSGRTHRETVRYAYIRQPNGKERRQQVAGNWQVGDYLRKVKGEMQVRKLN